jgi:hypothetical protein
VVEVEEDSTAAVVVVGFMVGAGQRFTGVEVSAAESTLGMSADARTADIMAAITEGGATTADITAVTVGAMAGAAGIGAEDMVTDGVVGELALALAGRIGDGDMDMDTPTATTTARDITRRDLIILTRPTVLRAIPTVIRITGTAIRNRQIPTRGLSPTRTDPQDTGRHRNRETYSARTTEARPRHVGRFCPLTG